MAKIRFLNIIALFLVSVSFLASQTTLNSRVKTSSSHCVWVGNIEATKDMFGRLETLTGTLRWELDETNPAGERYILAGGQLTWNASGTYGGCTVHGGPITINVSPDSGDNGILNIYNNGYYSGTASFKILTEINQFVTLICDNNTMTTGAILGEMIVGSQTDSSFIQNDVMSGVYGNNIIPGVYYASYTWNFHKESPAGTKLEVDAAGYESWIPKAGRNGAEDPGDTLKFLSRLIEIDGSTACAQADSFTYELKNVSREPGYCMNYPRAEEAVNLKDYDLHFSQELNLPTDIMSSDRLSLQTKGGRESSASVSSFDWGAWGTLKVTAHMPGGHKIIGYLKGHPETTDIPIPKRSPDSKIADQWKIDHDVVGLADDDDSEIDPVGDGHPGDGFTLYEEYRGFQENDQHIFGDTKRKDLFVFTDNPDFYPGIQLFMGLTGLNVHYQLHGFWEFDRSVRLMNFNHLEGAHTINQHGLWLKNVYQYGASFTSALGPPKKVDSVNISRSAYGFRTIIRGSMKEITSELNVTVAHELGHAVHISHHGDIDEEKTWTTVITNNPATGNFDYAYSESGHQGPVYPRWENDKPFIHNLQGTAYTGVWGGQHSGVEDCIMRYDCAAVYIPGPGTTSNIRYVVMGTERTGLFLCDKKDDNPDGVNYVSRQPRSRYGSATNGNCKSQICVNDKYY